MTIESPCQKICVLDPVTELCIGCGRTTREIGGWIGMSQEERRAVMVELPERMRGMTSRDKRGDVPSVRQRDRGAR